jgi:hypothetical protein
MVLRGNALCCCYVAKLIKQYTKQHFLHTLPTTTLMLTSWILDNKESYLSLNHRFCSDAYDTILSDVLRKFFKNRQINKSA